MSKEDVFEIIYCDSKSKVICETVINQSHSLKYSIPILAELGKDIILYLDFHRVADLYSDNETISDKNICVVSFMGINSETRKKVRDIIITRITGKQIKVGILVFKRTEQPNIIGTKAWILNKMINNELKTNFIDDGQDHITSVSNTKIKNLTVHLVNNKDENIQNKKIRSLIKHL